jgi:undecaprenyl phosphate N,N'-diacetylbacillosamine 1-phosphate transferase
MMYSNSVKRIVDVLVSFFLILITAPVIIIGVMAVRLSSHGPIFFLQKRVGRDEKRFTIYKIRSMHVDPAREPGQTRKNDRGVFLAGRLLRRFKIDEIPQLFNVLIGDMSLIGPRPCLEDTINEMPGWARVRFSVRPGLSGLAQVSGNIELSWEERWRYDIQYVSSCSFILDAAIALKTVLVILFGENQFVRKT